jgi:hypothetical protein
MRTDWRLPNSHLGQDVRFITSTRDLEAALLELRKEGKSTLLIPGCTVENESSLRTAVYELTLRNTLDRIEVELTQTTAAAA